MDSNDNQQYSKLQELLDRAVHIIYTECRCQCIGIKLHQSLESIQKSCIGFSTETWERCSFDSYAIIPIVYRQRTVGEIHLADQRQEYLTDELIRVVRLIAPLVGEIICSLQLEEQRRRYLGLVIHEIRNPLSVINGICALAKYEHYQVYENELSVILRKEVDRINGLLNDLALALLPQNSGQLSLNFRRINLSIVAISAAESMRIIYPKHEITVECNQADDCTVYGDDTRLEEVVRNLVSNAAKYSPDNSRILISLSVANYESVLLTVSDSGIGVPEDQKERVFEPFFQGHGAPKKGGMGLGLHICSEIVRQHAGKIWLKSKPGYGTVFFVELPRFEKKAAEARGERQ